MSNCKLPHLAHLQNQERGTPVITANQSKATIKMLPTEAASHYEATSKYKAALQDEAASKECGAITLDLLLHAGVIIDEEGGGWKLAPDYHLRRIHLFGDAKTIENVAKIVRGMQS